MKKIFFLAGFSFIGLLSFGQKLSFSKGQVAPGKISNARAYEDFLSGKIEVTDEKGNKYTFVHASFTEKQLNGKTISLEITQPSFPEEKRGDIARASKRGTTYTFTNVVVKDINGKEYSIPTVTYELAAASFVAE